MFKPIKDTISQENVQRYVKRMIRREIVPVSYSSYSSVSYSLSLPRREIVPVGRDKEYDTPELCYNTVVYSTNSVITRL